MGTSRLSTVPRRDSGTGEEGQFTNRCLKEGCGGAQGRRFRNDYPRVTDESQTPEETVPEETAAPQETAPPETAAPENAAPENAAPTPAPEDAAAAQDDEGGIDIDIDFDLPPDEPLAAVAGAP